MSYRSPYKGLKVVDLRQGVAGPYVGMLLAQYGADVVKVEPLGGDWSRSISKRYEDHSAFSVPANLGKRSLALDVKSPEGIEIMHDFLVDADIFIEGFRPGGIQRLGIGYEGVSDSTRESCTSPYPALVRPVQWPSGRRWIRCFRPLPA